MQSLWMLLASFLFAAMGVCVKLAAELYTTSEIVMYRGMMGAGMLFVLSRLRGDSMRTPLPWAHLTRGVIGVTALWLWFYAIGRLPLAMSMTLNSMAPIWIAAILLGAAWWRGQGRLEWGCALAVMASFGGVTLLLQPSMQASQWFAACVALVSSVISALAYLQVRKLGQLGEPEYRVVFYFSVTGALAGALGSLATPWIAPGQLAWHGHTAHGLLLLAGVGLCATVAQMAMTRAYRLGHPLVTANLQYTGIVFSSIWGILLWSDALGWMGWAGIAIILASGSAATFYNSRGRPVPAPTTVPAAGVRAVAAKS
ncbi:DMT family transporter|uniref:DMT family transporter n=1 Tax=Noviherbaspirillum sp. L7-7A TaxID=2850560 RepID=UPI001C2C3B8E|nr:DMT family transporter [Noviherbaspirillum sp. L7-7A]MBV0880325.1 DMT family transporter [Noviherbaspirillum sp. L7-7A]